MKVLHIYPKNDDMIAQYANMLAEGMRNSAEILVESSAADFKNTIRKFKPDIVHCHGCWQYAVVRAAEQARKQGSRIVLTPHGQLEPWLLNERYLQEKLFKTLMWQHSSVEQAYAVVALGKMEQRHLEKLGWNRRVELIRNCVITNTISLQQMCSQMFAVYQKVTDSDPLEQMDEQTQKNLAAIIKAGITGDSRWVDRNSLEPDNTDWRRLLIYAELEGIKGTVEYGATILGIAIPLLDTGKISFFLPDQYKKPQSIRTIIGEYKGDETDYVLRMIKQISRRPLLLHITELARELRRDSISDTKLTIALEDQKLLKFAQRLMTVMHETTQLEEGFMPVSAIDDRHTQHIRNSIINNLKL